jgi:hypothetical protein
VIRTHRNYVTPQGIRVGGFQSFGDVLESELDFVFQVCGDVAVFLPAALAGGSDCVAEDEGLGEVELG